MATKIIGITKEMEQSIATYKKYGIHIEAALDVNGALEVKVEQKRVINGYILTNKQLYDRAKEVFTDFKGTRHIKPIVFKFDHSEIDAAWINNRMKKLGINRNDLLNQLQFDKETLSLILNGKRGLTRLMKAAFFYYFLTFELNRELRDK